MTVILNDIDLQMTLTGASCIMKFYWFDLDHDPMTSVLKPDLDIVKIYVYMCVLKMKLLPLMVQKLQPEHTQTDRLDWNYYLCAFADGNEKLKKMWASLTTKNKATVLVASVVSKILCHLMTWIFNRKSIFHSCSIWLFFHQLTYKGITQ